MKQLKTIGLGFTGAILGVLFLAGITFAADIFTVDEGGTVRLRISNAGNVGVGTAVDATSRLEVKGSGTTNATSALNVTDSAGASKLYVRDDGNVGVGTTSPDSKIHTSGGYLKVDNIGNTGVNAGVSMKHETASFSSMVGAGGVGNPNLIANWDISTGTQDDVTKPSWNIGLSITADQMLFRRAPAGGALTTQMIINNTGNVGIGTTNPGSKFSVVGLPTSAAGLSSGDIWIDTTAGNALKIVP